MVIVKPLKIKDDLPDLPADEPISLAADADIELRSEDTGKKVKKSNKIKHKAAIQYYYPNDGPRPGDDLPLQSPDDPMVLADIAKIERKSAEARKKFKKSNFA